MSFISLEGSIRTCKVDTAQASRMESDRFFNSNNMLCPPWKGVDTSGRSVCTDSFNTKTAGCNDAGDRISVENTLRPQYFEYLGLDASGVRLSTSCTDNGKVNPESACHRSAMADVHSQTGQFGGVSGFSGFVMPSCSSCDKKESFKHSNRRQKRKVRFGF